MTSVLSKIHAPQRADAVLGGAVVVLVRAAVPLPAACRDPNRVPRVSPILCKLRLASLALTLFIEKAIAAVVAKAVATAVAVAAALVAVAVADVEVVDRTVEQAAV